MILPVLLAQAGCSPGEDAPGAAAARRDTTPASVNQPRAAQDSALRSAAESIVAFLRGAATGEALSMADTVTLLIPAEGGGSRRLVPRGALRDRGAWSIEANGRQYSFIPPADYTEMTVAPGRHINCLEGRLGDRVPELAAAPHVGVRLAAPGAASCLQGWNATFVFDGATRPRLTAAIYDQWEW